MFARAPSVARTGGRSRAARMLDRAITDAGPLVVIRNGTPWALRRSGYCTSWPLTSRPGATMRKLRTRISARRAESLR